MTSNAKMLLFRLRDRLRETEDKLSAVERETEITYTKLRAFKLTGSPLSIEDADRLHKYFFGNSFIKATRDAR